MRLYVVTSNTLHDVRSVHATVMVGEFLLAGCFALGCAVFGCGVVYLAAKFQADRQGGTEDTWR